MVRDASRATLACGWDTTRMRAARRILAPLALVVLLCLGAPRASADIGWCKTDPGLAIGDEVVSITVSAPPGILQVATGPTDVAVYVPVGTAAEVLWTDPGFGYGETVTIVESDRLHAGKQGIEIIVDVTVPAFASASVPVLVEIEPRSAGVVTASASGSTNGTVRLWTTV